MYLFITGKVKEYILETQTFWDTSIPLLAGLLCWLLTFLINRWLQKGELSSSYF